jgi:hypothetical protein
MSATLVTELERLADALGGEEGAECPISLAPVAERVANAMDENRPEIDNNFPNTRHASVFEGVLMEGRDTVNAIQKIISAPILAEGRVISVLQISRKGTSLRAAGPDFTQEDLGKVLALCHPLGKLLPHFAAA